MDSQDRPRDRGFRPRALGEIAIRCADLAPMIAFYRDVVGLELLALRTGGRIVFFRIGDGFGGHTAVLALFDRTLGTATGPPETGEGSSLHHVALSLPFEEQDAVMRWYDWLGQPYHVEEFGWIGWRGVFTKDPEGNTVELVAYDASLVESATS